MIKKDKICVYDAKDKIEHVLHKGNIMNYKKFIIPILCLLPCDMVLAADENHTTTKKHTISIGGSLELRKAVNHTTVGNNFQIAIQPVDRHRLKLRHSFFSNDQGAASDSGTSFGLGDFFACLFGSCNEEDNSVNTGGNQFHEYREDAALYQYQISSNKTGANSTVETWAGLGVSSIERTTLLYQINNGQNTDFVGRSKTTGVAWEINFVNRHPIWYWETALLGSTAHDNYGMSIGVGVGF